MLNSTHYCDARISQNRHIPLTNIKKEQKKDCLKQPHKKVR